MNRHVVIGIGTITLVAAIVMVAIGLPIFNWERRPFPTYGRLTYYGTIGATVGVPTEVVLPIKGDKELRVKAFNLETGQDESAALSCLNEVTRSRKITYSKKTYSEAGVRFRVARMVSFNQYRQKSETKTIFISPLGILTIGLAS